MLRLSERYARGAITLALAFALPSAAHAQAMGTMVLNSGKNAIGDVWSVWTSPLRGSGRDWLIAAGVLAGSAALSPLDDGVDRWAVNHANDNVFDALNPFREGGDAFSGRTIAPLAGGALIISILTKNQKVQDGVFGCLSSYASNYGVRHGVVNPIVGRRRPDTRGATPTPPAKEGDQYDFRVPSNGTWEERSFLGGHASNIASCGSFLINRFEMGAFEAIPWAAIGAVSFGRILDRRHWLSDQVLGVATGYAIGKAVADRSLRRSSDRAVRAGEQRTSVIADPDPLGFKIGFARTF